MNIRKTFQGAYEISAIKNGYLVVQQYFFYTRKEAIAEFRQYLKTLAVLLAVCCSTARAETTYTDVKPLIGCYKQVESDQCVDDTLIKCAASVSENFALYGSVVANFCDDINWQARQIIKADRTIRKLRAKLAKRRA